jgi:hypothetical protein
MARSKGFRYKVEDLVIWGYKKGLWQSFIINTSVLLVLALSFVSMDSKIMPISLVFSPPEEIEDIDLSEQEEIKIEIAGDVLDAPPDDAYMIDTPADQEIMSVNLDYDTPIDVSPVKEFTPSDLLAAFENQKNAIDPWSEAPETTGKGKPSRRGSGGTGNGSAGNGRFEKMEERLKKRGAKTGDVQVSISWDDFNDIDVWVYVESRQYSNHISWTNRSDAFGGMLDVDCNVHPTTKEAVENIFWPKGSCPAGNYTVFIHRFKNWENKYNTKVDVRMLFGDKVVNRTITVTHDEPIKVFTFTKKSSGSPPKMMPLTNSSPLMDRLMGDAMPGY